MTIEDFRDLITLHELDGGKAVLEVLHESKWPAPLAGKMAAVVQHVAESRVRARRNFEDGPLAVVVHKLPPL